MANKLKIGNKEFYLKGYYQSTHKNRPSWVFNIEEEASVIKALLTDGQTFVVASIADEETSERDLTDECALFGSLLEENDNTCVLTMENYSDIELLQQMINDLLEV